MSRRGDTRPRVVSSGFGGAHSPLLQRQCACGQHTPGGGTCSTCRGEGNRTGTALPAAVDQVGRSPGRPLDPATRAVMEARFSTALRHGRPLSPVAAGPQAAPRVNEPGDRYEREADGLAQRVMSGDGSAAPGGARRRVDFSRVRVHTGPTAHAAAQSVQAKAYTLGNHVVFNAGYTPEEPAGRALLAHELAHVEQQRQGGFAGGVIQRVGFGQAIARFFGGGTFTEEELKAYLTSLRSNRAIEDAYDSDNKAREVVRRWKAGDAAFSVLEIPVRILLIKEMTDGFLSADDQEGILALLEEAIPSERVTMLAQIGVDELKRRMDEGHRKRLEALVEQQDVDVLSMSDPWSVAGVQQILHRHGDHATIRTIIDQGIKVISFETAFDKWRYDADGRVEENELPGLQGNRDGTELRIRKSLTNQAAASTIFHEVSHYTSPVPDYLEQEIQVRVSQELFNIRHGLPPVQPGYRNADGTVNEATIRSEISGSSHYNPTGRTRIARRYVGEVPVGGWSMP